MRAAETGRHIVIEKPVGVTLEDSIAIRDAVAKAGVKTVTSFVLRWNPQFVTVKQLIADGVPGDLVYGEADYWHPLADLYPGYRAFVSKAQGVSAFVCGGCHAVDILRYLGGEIVEVSAFSAAKRMNDDFEYDPIVVASLRFENGAVGKLATILEADTPYIFNCKLFGTKGTIIDNEVYSSIALSGEPRLLGVPDGQAGFGRRRAPSVQGRDRSLPRVHRDRHRVARVDPRQLEVDVGVLRDRRVGGGGRAACAGAVGVTARGARRRAA